MPEPGPIPVLIIGAGLTGLTVAHHLPLSRPRLILEKTTVPGGLATQFKAGDYWFDYGGHYFHFQHQTGLKTELEQFTPFHHYQRQSKTFLLDRYIPFPVQFHLAHLPAPYKHRVFREMQAHHQLPHSNQPSHFNHLLDFLLYHFGPTLTKLFFLPFLTKYYDTPPHQLASHMDRGSIPVPDLQRVQDGYAGKTYPDAGYNASIFYPTPSLRHFIQNYAAPIESSIRYNQQVIAINPREKTVSTHSHTYSYQRLISTMPLNQLLELLPTSLLLPSPHLLRHTSTLLVNAVLQQKRKRFHWVYLPDKKIPFYRAGLYAGQNHPICYLERNLPPQPAPHTDPEKLFQDVVFTLKKLQVIKHAKEIIFYDARIIPVSYVVFDLNWHQLVPPTLEKLAALDIHSIGRYGTWNYSSMANDIHNAKLFTSKLEHAIASNNQGLF